MRNFFLVVFMLIFATVSNAQSVTTTLGVNDMFASDANLPEYGKVTLTQDKYLIKLVNKYIEYNDVQKGFAGWRVHIYFGTGYGAREKAEEIKQKFEKGYPGYPVYIVYESPYFRVHVGDFRISEKNDAYKLKKRVEVDFPNSWIQSATINYPNLHTTQVTDTITVTE